MSLAITLSVSFFAQNVSDLKFTTFIADTENSYVVFNKKDTDVKYSYGFVYFDEFAGYSFRSLGSFVADKGVLKIGEPEEWEKTSMMVSRIGNFGLKVAKLDNDFLKKINLPVEPDWLKNYKSSAPENEKIVKRASRLNGFNYPQLALPRLQKLYDNNYKSTDLFFELSFSYNALRDFTNAEKYSKEGINLKMSNDNLFKEHIYALLNQKKAKEADVFLTKNLTTIKDNNAKIEAVNNMVAYCAQINEIDIAKRWFVEFKKIAVAERYNKQIEILTNLIKENDKISK